MGASTNSTGEQSKRIPLLRIDYSDDDVRFIQDGVAEILASGYLTMDKKVAEFERQFAEFIGVKYAIAVNSGTSALEIPLRALGVEGKSVIVPTITYMATPLAAIHAGAKVVFVDVMPENLSLDPDDLKRKIRKDTVGVIPVHIGGIISPYWQEIESICQEHGLFVLEDAAHAHGASIEGRMAGSLGAAGAFSFYPTKVLNAAEGGIITTNDNKLFEMSVVLREHGKQDHRFNIHTELGYNWRFSEFHALLGLQQMKKVREIIEERQRLAKKYDDELEGIRGITRVIIPSHISCPYYKYIIYLDEQYDREVVKMRLKDEFGVSLPGEVYAEPCHSQPVFKKYPDLMQNASDDQFPGSCYVSQRQICIPLYPGLKDDEVGYVVKALKQVLE
jgi:perosamine synthetase